MEAKTVRQATGLSIWNYVKSKMTGAISTFVTDDMTGNRVLVSTPLGKITYSPDITTEELSYLNNARSNIQDQIDDKMDSIVMGAETDIMVDTTPLTYLDVPNNETHVTRGSTIWTYIKSKLNVDNLTTITDSTKIGSVDKSKTNVVQQFTAAVLFQYMWKKIYPVGSIYMSTSSTNPATLFGGTWERLKDTFLLANGDSYAPNTTGGSATKTIATNNLPSHTHSCSTAGSHTHTQGSLRIRGSIVGSDNDEVFTAIDSLTQSGALRLTDRVDRGAVVTTGGIGYRGIAIDTNNANSWSGATSTAGNHTHTIGATGSGLPLNVMPPYTTVYAWRRTA